ncbi:hypothetical protein Dthio_PD0097 [Desulfonatronospira thiodismutans ASO3-1]|uniref:Uncharacterized protein n=1 Tax=Desulfonatronospira thiodismutans ASO3-1 TaxID=555779 RepID=D6SV43_9BACT|nr:hypothetical protein [Desulfonatronospira thiodismutans]EFI32799.1 hypothetical protein Dthio_PD0097 [Desulfonatronospira thiodismutans ASO3-1]
MATLVYLGENYNNETFTVNGQLDFRIARGMEYENIEFAIGGNSRDVEVHTDIAAEATFTLTEGIDYDYVVDEDTGSILVQDGDGNTMLSLEVGADLKTVAQVRIGDGEETQIELDPDTSEIKPETRPQHPEDVTINIDEIDPITEGDFLSFGGEVVNDSAIELDYDLTVYIDGDEYDVDESFTVAAGETKPFDFGEITGTEGLDVGEYTITIQYGEYGKTTTTFTVEPEELFTALEASGKKFEDDITVDREIEDEQAYNFSGLTSNSRIEITEDVDLTYVADFGDVTIDVSEGATLTISAAQATALAEAGGSVTGDGSVTVTGLDGDDIYDLSGITASASAEVDTVTLRPDTNLGDIEITVADTHTFTLTAAQADGRTIVGDDSEGAADDGNVFVTDIEGDIAYDFSAIGSENGTVTADDINADDYVDGEITFPAGIQLGDLDITLVSDPELTMAAADADGATIDGDGTVILTGDAAGADLSGISAAGVTIDLRQVTGDFELEGADADAGLMGNTTSPLILTSVQADGQELESAEDIDVHGNMNVDLREITDGGTLTVHVTESQSLSLASRMPGGTVIQLADGVVLTASAAVYESRLSGLNVNEPAEGTAEVKITGSAADVADVTKGGSNAQFSFTVTGDIAADAAAIDLSAITDSLTFESNSISVGENAELTLNVAQANGVTITGDGETKIITGAVEEDTDLTGIANLVDNPTTLTIKDGYTLTVTAEQAAALTSIVNDGDDTGDVEVIVGTDTPVDVDLSNVGVTGTDTFTLQVDATKDLTTAASVDTADIIQISGSYTLTLTPAQADATEITGGTVVVDGDIDGATADFTQVENLTFESDEVNLDSETLTLTASQADGVKITESGGKLNVIFEAGDDGTVNLATGSATAADLYGTAVVSGNMTLAAGEEDKWKEFTSVTVADDVTLTLSAEQADTIDNSSGIIQGAGSVMITGNADGDYDLSGIVTTGLSFQGNSISVDGGKTLTLTPAQADGVSVTGDGALDVIGDLAQDQTVDLTNVAADIEFDGDSPGDLDLDTGAEVQVTVAQADAVSFTVSNDGGTVVLSGTLGTETIDVATNTADLTGVTLNETQDTAEGHIEAITADTVTLSAEQANFVSDLDIDTGTFDLIVQLDAENTGVDLTGMTATGQAVTVQVTEDMELTQHDKLTSTDAVNADIELMDDAELTLTVAQAKVLAGTNKIVGEGTVEVTGTFADGDTAALAGLIGDTGGDAITLDLTQADLTADTDVEANLNAVGGDDLNKVILTADQLVDNITLDMDDFNLEIHANAAGSSIFTNNLENVGAQDVEVIVSEDADLAGNLTNVTDLIVGENTVGISAQNLGRAANVQSDATGTLNVTSASETAVDLTNSGEDTQFAGFAGTLNITEDVALTLDPSVYNETVGTADPTASFTTIDDSDLTDGDTVILAFKHDGNDYAVEVTSDGTRADLAEKLNTELGADFTVVDDGTNLDVTAEDGVNIADARLDVVSFSEITGDGTLVIEEYNADGVLVTQQMLDMISTAKVDVTGADTVPNDLVIPTGQTLIMTQEQLHEGEYTGTGTIQIALVDSEDLDLEDVAETLTLNATVDDSENITGDNIDLQRLDSIEVADTFTLTATAAQITGVTVVSSGEGDDDGSLTVEATTAAMTEDLDLSNVSLGEAGALTVEVTGIQDLDLTENANLGNMTHINITGVAETTYVHMTGDQAHEVDLTADANTQITLYNTAATEYDFSDFDHADAVIDVTDLEGTITFPATLDGDWTMTAAQAHEADFEVTGTLNIVDPHLTPAMDLSALTMTGTVNVEFDLSEYENEAINFTGDLGGATVNMGLGAVMIADADTVDDVTFEGPGTVQVMGDLTGNALSNVESSLDLTKADEGTEPTNMPATVAEGITITLTPAQADGFAVTGLGTVVVEGVSGENLDFSNIESSLNLRDADLTGEVELRDTIGDNLTLTADASLLDEVTIGGDGKVVVLGDASGVDLSGISADMDLTEAEMDETTTFPTVAADQTLTMNITDAEELDIPGNGTIELTGKVETDIDMEDFQVGDNTLEFGDEIEILDGYTLTAESRILHDVEITGQGSVVVKASAGRHILDLGEEVSANISFEIEDDNLTIKGFDAEDDVLNFSNMDLDNPNEPEEAFQQYTLGDDVYAEVVAVDSIWDEKGDIETAGSAFLNEQLAEGSEMIFMSATASEDGDTKIWHWDDTNDDGEIDEGELTLIGVLEDFGKDCLSNITEANFSF